MVDTTHEMEYGRGRPRLSERSKDIGGRIRTARIAAGLRIIECAKTLQISISQYNYLERVCSPKQEESYLTALASLFKVSGSWLAAGTGEAVTKSKPFPTLGPEEAQRLGARARARRDELSLPRQTVAERLGTAPMNLLKWEQRLSKVRKPEEMIWEQVLRVPEGWLRNTTLKAYAPAPFPLIEAADTRTVVDDIRAVCCWFSQKNPFDRTVDYDVLDEAERRMVDMMMYRFGAHGEDASTLQSIGDRFGLTRERIRQITEEFTANLDASAITMPALDRLKTEIQPRLPCKVSDLDSALSALMGGALSIAGADRFARELLGRSLVNVTTRPANMTAHFTPMALHDEGLESDDVRNVRQVAVAMVRISGAAQVHFVAGMASSVLKRGIMPKEAILCSKMFSNFEWLSKEDGWFWFGPAMDNRAKTCALKVLSVATRNVDVEEIHDAMSRARLLRYDPDKPRPYMVDAPLSVLREVLGRIPGIERLQYNDFRLDVIVSPEEVLSDSELAVRAALLRHGGVATRYTLNEELVDTGLVSLMALNFVLDSSPIFVRIDTGIWALRGNKVSPEALAEAISNGSGIGRQRFFLDNAAPVNGWWTIRVSVPESGFNRRQWLVPSALARLLSPGDYAIDGYSEPAKFITEGGNASLGRFVAKLTDAGIQPGEIILLSVHAIDRRMRFERLA